MGAYWHCGLGAPTKKDVCVIDNLPALSLSLTKITSQNNGSFC